MNPCENRERIADCGPNPFITDIEKTTEDNPFFRRVLWTGKHLQVTVMCIPPGGEIGNEIHPHTDQFIRIEEGCACVMIGKCMNEPSRQTHVESGCAVMIPAGTWHNIINSGKCSLKLYSIYAPPKHPRGAVHPTKADAEKAEKD